MVKAIVNKRCGKKSKSLVEGKETFLIPDLGGDGMSVIGNRG